MNDLLVCEVVLKSKVLVSTYASNKRISCEENTIQGLLSRYSNDFTIPYLSLAESLQNLVSRLQVVVDNMKIGTINRDRNYVLVSLLK